MQKTILTVMLLMQCFYSNAQKLQLHPIAAFGSSYNAIHNAAEMNNVDLKTEADFKISYALGFGAQYFLGKHWAIGIDLMYSREGSNNHFRSINADIADLDYDKKIDATYICLPANISYYFRSTDKKLRPYISAGVAAGFLVKQRHNYVANNAYTQDVFERADMFYAVFKNFDLGMQMGVGCNYKITAKSSVFAEVKYYRGVIDPFGNDFLPDMRNENARLQIGYSFDI